MKHYKEPIFRLLAVLLGIALALASLEAALRTAAWLISAAQARANPQPDPQDRNEFRIVTLGESTTALFWSKRRDRSWPGALEKKLNAAGLGRTFKVINLAQSGTSSPFQTAEFLQQAQALRPHAVISMMGINDWVPLEYLRQSGLQSLRIVKLARWLRRRHPKKTISDSENGRIIALLKDRLGDLAAASPEATRTAKKLAYTLAAEERENDWCALSWASHIFYNAAARMAQKGGPGGAAAPQVRELALAAFELAGRALKLNPLSPRLATYLVYPAILLSDEDLGNRALALLHAAMDEGLEPDPALLTLLAGINGLNNPKMNAIVKERGFRLNYSQSYFMITMFNYRRLAAAARERGIVYLAMQYPTGNTAALKNLFSSIPKTGYSAFRDSIYDTFPDQNILPQYQDIIFIGNENFKKFTGDDLYSAYFTDQFVQGTGGRFGHATSVGHELIARNAAGTIIANWPEISGRPRDPAR
ncbi:MAG: hypothetical protein A2234_06105 [Elusimicrobia bacterium RIFOXYA2_FULL_58_8]|nr:MAG: hypothetical protein A2285_00220 [Elusimicrobia bacterium RIFOXYA12_FULL_57_11]OGS17030.1 MAG: hypothetical protein A2234_06105 [Elusimicrobia bacterium RIFOXYA2_FULL_58_8]